jgi:hypothetical protein
LLRKARSVAFYPAAVDADPKLIRKQTRKGTGNDVVDNVLVAIWVHEAGKVRQDQLVGNGGIVKCQGAGKIPIAGDAMRIGRRNHGKRAHRRGKHFHRRGQPSCEHPGAKPSPQRAASADGIGASTA